MTKWMNLPGVCRFSCYSVTDFWFVSIEYTMYNFSSFKFTGVCFTAQDMVCLGRCFHGHLKRTYVLLMFGGVFCKCWFTPVDGVAEFFSVFADFLYNCSVSCWERGEASRYNCQFFYSSFQFYHLPNIWQLCCLMQMHLGVLCLSGLTLYLLCNILLCHCQFSLHGSPFYRILI